MHWLDRITVAARKGIGLDGKRFDSLTRLAAGGQSRRGFFKGLAAAAAGLAGVRALESDASATGMARITIHNAQCNGKPKGDIYEACHDNGFGCVDFRFRGRVIRTNHKGVASARIGAGSFTISQQASRVRKSSSIYVYCSNTNNGHVLYDGGAATGAVSFHVPRNANVVCDWYNMATTDLAMPGQCPQPTTTPRPTTTTTTTTLPPRSYCLEPIFCTVDSECAELANSFCDQFVCTCDVGFHFSDAGVCEKNETIGEGVATCESAYNNQQCNTQYCRNDCGPSTSYGGRGLCVNRFPGSSGMLCAGDNSGLCSSDSDCAAPYRCVNFGGQGNQYCALDCDNLA